MKTTNEQVQESTTIIYDNYNVDYDEMYNEYKEFCKVNEFILQDRESNAFYEWVGEMLSMFWEDLFGNLKYSKQNVECVVTGKVSLWHGKYNIKAKFFETLEDAIRYCSSEYDAVVITESNGTIEVKGIHHDGTNHFYIHKLNEKGIEAYDEDEDIIPNKEEYFEKFEIDF